MKYESIVWAEEGKGQGRLTEMKRPRVQQPTSVDLVSVQSEKAKARKGSAQATVNDPNERDSDLPRSSISQRTQENEHPHNDEHQRSKHDQALPSDLGLQLWSQPRRPSSDRDRVVDGFREDEVEDGSCDASGGEVGGEVVMDEELTRHEEEGEVVEGPGDGEEAGVVVESVSEI